MFNELFYLTYLNKISSTYNYYIMILLNWNFICIMLIFMLYFTFYVNYILYSALGIWLEMAFYKK